MLKKLDLDRVAELTHTKKNCVTGFGQERVPFARLRVQGKESEGGLFAGQ